MSDESIPHRRRLDAVFAGGLAWTAGAKWLTQLITWVSVLITARLLSPADFGLVEMAGFLFGITNVLAEFGVGTAVLQMRELDRRVLAQLNTASLLFCAVAFAGSVAAAPFIAAFFRSESLRLLVIVNSLAFFITAIQAVPQGLLQRDMDYRRLSISEAVMAITQAAATLGCAFGGLGYWSLVAGPFAGKLASAVLTAYWKPMPFALPRWKDVARPMRFGFEIASSRLAWAAYSQADGIVVGRMLGDSALGAYRIAINIASAPAEKIGMLIMRVTGPLFARIQDDRSLVRRYFFLISEALALGVLPLVLGLAVVAPETVAVLLGRRWEGATGPLQWLAVFMTLRTMSSLVNQVLTSLRFTRFTMWISMLSFTLMPVSFYVASRWGASAVAATWIVMSPVTVLPSFVKLCRAIDCKLRDYLGILTPAMVGTAAMIGVVLGIRLWMLPAGLSPIWRLAIQVAAGGAVYWSILWGVYRERVLQYVRFLAQLREDRDVLAAGKP